MHNNTVERAINGRPVQGVLDNPAVEAVNA